ncbi:MAG: restriction endonuclease subunit S [Candidatus Kapabacteria bacterium]|jgi:type I restriction enzyme S subunit|nr:restriction endonuclease subunit S [Candidatus Kapabacteria bacterium]
MTNWKEYKLGEIGEVITGKTPSKKNPEQWGDIMPFVTPTDFDAYNKNIVGSIRYLSAEGINAFQKKVLPQDSVIVTCIGSQMGKVALNKKECVTNQQINSIIPHKEFDSDFIYYVISSMQDYLRNLATGGSTMPIVNKSTFEEITIKAPDLPTQTAIAEILSSLDDKIELNNKINQELENLAQTLFKQWFIDFEFPNENGKPYKSSGGEMVDSELGEIPKGWEVKPIGDLFEFVIGGDWGKDDIDDEHSEMNYVIRGTDIPTLKSGSKNGVPYRAIKPSKLKNRQLEVNDIIIEISGGSKRQPTGRTVLITKEILERLDYNAIPASFCRLIRPKNDFAEFLGIYLTKIYDEGKTWEYQNQSTGISNFQFKFFESSEILALPSDLRIIDEFNSLISGFYNLMTTNENQELTLLRDTLLPKLISGELEVADIMAEKA